MSRPESITVRTADGLVLEGEFQPADGAARAAVVPADSAEAVGEED